jgi:nitrite reductase (NADH) small subunit
VAGEHIIALFHVETGIFHAIDGICAHQGGPLGRGCLEQNTVTCPWHGWQYDVSTGKHRLSEITQRRFPVRVEGEDVLVDVAEAV